MLAALLAVALIAMPIATAAAKKMEINMMMGGMDMPNVPRIPPVAGYAEDERIFFVHTEVSDPQIGQIMTEMMDLPVPVVASLANAPDKMLALVYAFTNGMQPDGPRGPLDFQPDVFDVPTGTPGYTPLRKIVLVTWVDSATPRILKSATEVLQAQAAGEIMFEEPGVVVNMPFLTWPGGQR